MYYHMRILRRNLLLGSLIAALIVVLVVTSIFSRLLVQHTSYADFIDAGNAQGRISQIAAPTSVVEFARFEPTFQIATSASNLQLPYESNLPSYEANLPSDEDSRLGITVNGLFLPPGQSDWSRAETQPAFWYEGYTANGLPTGEKDWHLRFAPNQVGKWQWRLSLSDAAGSAVSVPQVLDVMPTSATNPGFVQISSTDSRYFQTSQSIPLGLEAGANMACGDNGALSAMQNEAASGVIRVGASTNCGYDITGGFADNNFGHGIGTACDSSFSLSQTHVHSGRFSLEANCFAMQGIGFKPGDTYHFSMWVLPSASSGTSSVSLHLGDGNHILTFQNNGQWQQGTLTVSGSEVPSGSEVDIGFQNGATGYFDDIDWTDGQTGEDAWTNDGFEWTDSYDQKLSAQLDTLVTQAEASSTPEYLRLVTLEKNDTEWGEIGANGTAQAKSSSNATGGSGTPTGVETAVQRLQRFYARYLMARWGYSPAVEAFEYVNEQDPNSGINDTGAEVFGRNVHTLTADHRMLVSTSPWWVGSGNYPYSENLYENALYPDIDFADIHYYPGSGNEPETPYDLSVNGANGGVKGGNGFTLDPIGGYDNTGALVFDASTPGAVSNASQYVHVFDFIGQGTWTASYWYKSSPDAVATTAGLFAGGPEAQLRGGSVFNDPLHCDHPNIPDWTDFGYMFVPCANLNLDGNWHQVTRTFTVPTTAPAGGVDFTVFANISQGTIAFSDLEITAPDGLPWFKDDFQNTDLVDDSAAYASQLLSQAVTYSGDSRIGKPLINGESTPYTVLSTIRADPTGNFIRGFAWGSLAATSYLMNWWTEITSYADSGGYWKYYAYVQKFLKGTPLADGHWRNADATASSPDILSVGQSDQVTRRANLYVYNRTATWYNLATAPTPPAVAGSISFAMPDGTYTVERWDPGTGTILSTETDQTSGSVLTLNVGNLAQDVAFKVYSTAPSQATIQISAPYRTNFTQSNVTVSASLASEGSVLVAANSLTANSTGVVQLPTSSFASGLLTDTDSYNMGVTVPGYLRRNVLNLSHIFSTRPSIILVPGDFDGTNTIDLRNLVTSIRGYNGGTDAGAQLAQQTFGGAVNLADIVYMISQYRSGAIGD
jgi:hypothetical protein